jgi:hypothetical protein
LSFDKDEDDEVLAWQTLLASAKGVVSGSVLGSADVCHDEKALAEPCNSLFVVPAALGDKKGWVNVGLGGLPDHEPSSFLRKELERNLALSVGLKGGDFGASSVATRSAHVMGPSRASIVVILVIGSDSIMTLILVLLPRVCSPDAYGPYQWRRSPSAQHHPPSSSQSWDEVVCHSYLRAAVPPRPSPRCCKEFNVNASLQFVF